MLSLSSSNMRKRQPLPKPGSLRYVCDLKHVWHLLRSFAKFRKALSHHMPGRNARKEKIRNAMVARAYRTSTSHVLPFPGAMDYLAGDVHDSLFHYYDSTWNSIFPSADSDIRGLGAVGEDDGVLITDAAPNIVPVGKTLANAGDVAGNEIDRLADMFIAGFHEKFQLEKQESYRSFQEMLNRGV